ncbi:MAG: Hpt domain-containing protein [Bdellovibrionales bacterium]|nr:Hpt domain-containing protein [Bdellovibrionales bacterium]
MSQPRLAQLPPALLPAVRIFADEFDSHLEFLTTGIRLGEGGIDADPDTTKRLQHRFHTIRGSAGFFQLEAIRDAAHRGERLLDTKITQQNKEEILAALRAELAVLQQEHAALQRELSSMS